MTDTVRNPTMDNLRSLMELRKNEIQTSKWTVAYGGAEGIFVTHKSLFQDHHYRVDDNGIYEVREGYSFIKQYLP